MKILMVCLGNICRSPMADGLLRKKVKDLNMDVLVDSAGTSNLHVGEQPDARMRKTAISFYCPIDDLRARQFVVADFDAFDVIYAMDSSNYNNILKLARNSNDESKVKLILNELFPGENRAVPDPYYGGEQGFIDVYNMLDKATDKIIDKLRENGKR
jgi:protein-tyrosine phosphatase